MNLTRPQPRAIAAALLLAALPAFAAPARAQFPLDRNAMLEQAKAQREAQYRSAANMVAGMQPLRVKGIEELVALRMEGQHLVAESPLMSDDQGPGRQFRIELPQFKGPTYAGISSIPTRMGVPFRGRLPPQAMQEVQKVFTLQSYELRDGGTLHQFRLMVYPQAFTVERVTQFPEGNRVVWLTSMRPLNGQPGAVQLNLNEYGAAFNPGGAAGPAGSFNYIEPSFDALARAHPAETDAHLRPLLRQLGQEAALAPDPLVAWQVLGYPAPPDADAARAVDALLPALDDPDYRRRDAALAELLAMGRAGSAIILRMDRSDFSVERNLRLDRAIFPLSRLPGPAVARLRSDRPFLLDCLLSPDAAVRAAALARLRVVAGDDLRFDPAADDAARSAAVLALRERLAGRDAPTTAPATP